MSAETPHPTTQELAAFFRGAAGDRSTVWIALHLGTCAACRKRAGRTAPTQSDLPETDEHREVPSDPEPSWPPKQIGEYEILGEVGRGGMGVVYRARDRQLNRVVALKVLVAGSFASETQRLRFELEAKMAARLQHPNLVQVFEAGTHEGRPYLVMEWVDGGPLSDRLDGRPWSPRDAATFVETLARAVHYAHQHRILHRDLKPANILLTMADCRLQIADLPGGAPPPGQAAVQSASCNLQSAIPKVADFSLAYPMDDEAHLTQSGFVVGTPEYMAPEQATGRRDLLGPSTDVFALGVILYLLSTGKLPFTGATAMDILRETVLQEPTAPRKHMATLPRDLEAITLHCLEKDPPKRYPSAAALADDLRAFLEEKPVQARAVSVVTRAVRWCRRRPLIAALLFLLAATNAVGITFTTWMWLVNRSDRIEAEWQEYRSRIAAAAGAVERHDVVDARHRLDLRRDLEHYRNWEWQHLTGRLDDSLDAQPIPRMRPRPNRGDADGRWLVGDRTDGPGVVALDLRTGESQVVTQRDGLMLWDVQRVGATWLAVESDKVTAAERPRPFRLILRNLSGGEKSQELLAPSSRGLQHLAVDHLHGLILTRLNNPSSGRTILVYDLASGQERARLEGHQKTINDAVISPDGTRLATASDDTTVRIWDLTPPGHEARLLEGHTLKVMSIAYSPDGRRLATASADGTVGEWDTTTGRRLSGLPERLPGEIHLVRYTPDGRHLVTAGPDTAVRLWPVDGRGTIQVLHGHHGRVGALAFTEGRRILSASEDGTLRTWAPFAAGTSPVLAGHGSFVYPVAFSPDGLTLASGGWDSQVRLWDARTRRERAVLDHPRPRVVRGLCFGPNGSWLATVHDEGWVWLWDVNTGQLRRRLTAPSGVGSPRNVALSPDGTRLAVPWVHPGGREAASGLTVVNLENGESVALDLGEARRVEHVVAWSPDGQELAAGLGNDVVVWDARTYEQRAVLSGHERSVSSLAYHPGSRRLLSGSLDRTIRCWDRATGQWREWKGHTEEINTVVYHPQGDRVASSGKDGMIRLWDPEHGEEVARLAGHRGYVWSLAFSPDGQVLASGSGDTTVRLWDTRTVRERCANE